MAIEQDNSLASRLVIWLAWRILRWGSGIVSAIDGPFAETKEQLGGFFFIEAGSKDEAVSIAEVDQAQILHPFFPFSIHCQGLLRATSERCSRSLEYMTLGAGRTYALRPAPDGSSAIRIQALPVRRRRNGWIEVHAGIELNVAYIDRVSDLAGLVGSLQLQQDAGLIVYPHSEGTGS